MIRISDGLIRYELRPLEKIGALGLPPQANYSNLISVALEVNPWNARVLRGIRAPGTGFPYLIMLGTMRHRRGKDFCVVYKRNPVLVLDFKNEKWARWVVPASKENMASLADYLSSAAGPCDQRGVPRLALNIHADTNPAPPVYAFVREES